MSKLSTPRLSDHPHGYCWAEHPKTGVHCTQPAKHPPKDGTGGHYHPYSGTSW